MYVADFFSIEESKFNEFHEFNAKGQIIPSSNQHGSICGYKSK